MSKKTEEAAVDPAEVQTPVDQAQGEATQASADDQAAAPEDQEVAADPETAADPKAHGDPKEVETVRVVLTCIYGDAVPGDTVELDEEEAARLVAIGAANLACIVPQAVEG
jgi:hypothetical protein